MSLFVSEAFAQAAPAAPAAGQAPGGFMQFVPMILIFVVFYFLLIRPQIRKQREHADLVKSVKIGDQVISASGIVGTIRDMTDKLVTLEIASNVKIKMLRTQVSQVLKGNIEGTPAS